MMIDLELAPVSHEFLFTNYHLIGYEPEILIVKKLWTDHDTHL